MANCNICKLNIKDEDIIHAIEGKPICEDCNFKIKNKSNLLAYV